MNSSRTLGQLSERTSGVLLHPTSLPGGQLGSEALRFVDWLAEAGQRWWQVLPLGPPDVHGSPYGSASAFAGSELLLDRPSARVTTAQLEDFIAAQWYWAPGWLRHNGRGSLEDQVRFDREWTRLRDHAHAQGIAVLGDIPFYVARDGADHRDHPELFDDEHAAGVPPDDWSSTGQLWGSPVYDWSAMRHDGFRWWIERFRHAHQLVDAIRVDHFRGFVAYWSVPKGNRTAESGTWRKAPGGELFRTVLDTLGPLPLVAENLGVITPAVERLRRQLKVPGTVVLQFQFSESLVNRPPRRSEKGNVVYVGTHDNDTATSWWKQVSADVRANVEQALARAKIEEPLPNWKLMRLALHHEADLCILTAQDLLGLGNAARMNHPGRLGRNWKWRLSTGMLSKDLAHRLRDETRASLR